MGRRANHLLRQARLRLPSPSGSDQPMSRADLAEAANHWLYEQTGKTFTMDANQVGKYERGENRWPHRHYRQALCAVLGAADPAGLGFYPYRSAGDASSSILASVGNAAPDDPLGDRDGSTLDLQVLAFGLPAGGSASAAGFGPEVPAAPRRDHNRPVVRLQLAGGPAMAHREFRPYLSRQHPAGRGRSRQCSCPLSPPAVGRVRPGPPPPGTLSGPPGRCLPGRPARLSRP